MQFCTKCGRQLADDAAFCDGCGQSLSAPASQKVEVVPPRDYKQEATVKRNKGVGVLLILAGVAIIVVTILLVMAQL